MAPLKVHDFHLSLSIIIFFNFQIHSILSESLHGPSCISSLELPCSIIISIYFCVCVWGIFFMSWQGFYLFLISNPSLPLAPSKTTCFIYFEWTLTLCGKYIQNVTNLIFLPRLKRMHTHDPVIFNHPQHDLSCNFRDAAFLGPVGTTESVLLIRNTDALWSSRACSNSPMYLK